MKPKIIPPLRIKKPLVLQYSKEFKYKFCTPKEHQQASMSNYNKDYSLNQNSSLLSLINKKLHCKYNCSPDDYNNTQLFYLLKGKKSHLVCVFKDEMIFNFVSEFLKRFYRIAEINEMLKKFYQFYAKYFLFFCKPNFSHFILSKTVNKYYEKKAEIYYFTNYSDTHKTKAPDSTSNNKIFSTTVNEDIDQRSITTSNIFQTNFEYYNSNKKNHSKKTFIDSMCELSLIYKNYNKAITNTENNFINDSWSPYLNNLIISSDKDNVGDMFQSQRETIFASDAIAMRYQNNNNNKPQPFIVADQKTQPKLTKIKASEIKNQPSLKQVTPINIIEKKTHPKILIEFSNNQKKYNRYVLPHTKSTGDIMKVSFVIYTNQNESRRKKFKFKNQPAEIGVSTPTVNNVNINIHNRVNISPTIINNDICSKIYHSPKLLSTEGLLSPWKSTSSRNKIDYNTNRIPYINNTKETNKRTISFQLNAKLPKNKINLYKNVPENILRIAKITDSRNRLCIDPFSKLYPGKKDLKEPINCQKLFRVNSQARMLNNVFP